MSDIKLAERVIEAYSSGLDGLNAEECRDLDISDAQCAVLREVLKTGPEGSVVMGYETSILAFSGFSQDFINLPKPMSFIKSSLENYYSAKGSVII